MASRTRLDRRNVVAMGGGGFAMDSTPLLDDFILSLTRRMRPRVCFIATAAGDSDRYLTMFHEAFPPARAAASHLRLFDRTVADLRRFALAQDVIYVGGGNTANLLAIWRLHGLDAALREAWEAGVVLCGVSAGALCWFEAGITDSFGRPLARLHDGLGLIAGSFCPHYDGERDRRGAFHRFIEKGLPAGYAADDGAALHFVGTRLTQAVSSRRGARAWRVELHGGRVIERALAVRYLGRSARRQPR